MPEGEVEDLITNEIVGFVMKASANKLGLDDLPIYDPPLVGFAPGNDPIFMRFKEVIGDFHRTPFEMMEHYAAQTGGRIPDEDSIGVIAIVLPMHAATVRENARMSDRPSRRWMHGKYHGGPLRRQLARHMNSFFAQMGHVAFSPEDEPGLHKILIDPRVGLASTWSLRHVAYAAGLGTFGLSGGLITKAGIAEEVGSILVDIPFACPERSEDIHAACLHYQTKRCLACAKRCPAGAITEKGHDKERCGQFAFAQTPLNKERYGIESYGCGLCFSGVPCSNKNPVSPKRKARNEESVI